MAEASHFIVMKRVSLLYFEKKKCISDLYEKTPVWEFF
jgi:hypothetical protein